MQLCTLHKPETTSKDKSLFESYTEYVEKYNHVSIVEIENMHFIIKSLGRMDYRDIMLNQDLDNYLKEEAVCELCCLYPENFNFEDCEAGIPSALFQEILTFSFLSNDQEQDRRQLMNYFRSEMVELHNQINCMINEAFPSLGFETIENFDMMTALKYLSRAEWILQNLRNFEIARDPFTNEEWDADQITPSQVQTSEKMPEPVVNKTISNKLIEKEDNETFSRPKVDIPGEQNSFIPGETIEERLERLKKGEIKPKKLTPEKLRELQHNFPEIDWTAQLNQDDFNVNVETTPMALRTPDQIYKEE